MINKLEVTNHLTKLHNLAKGINGKLVLASYGEGLTPIVEHFAIGEVEAMAQRAVVLGSQNGRNVYTPLAVMREDLPPKSKGTEKDVVAILGFVADFDKGLGANYSQNCPITPSFVMETSPNNAQCHYFLGNPIIINSDSDRAAVKELAIKLTQNCEGADTCGVDTSHVWRIAGLPNYPNAKKLREGRSPTPFNVRVLDDSNKLVSATQIESLKTIAPKTEKVKEFTTQLEYKNQIKLSELDSKLAELIENGAKIGERSEAVSKVVWSLLSLGYSTGDIVNLIYSHTHGIGERYCNDRNRIEADVLRLAQKKPDTLSSDKNKATFTMNEFEPINESDIPCRTWILGSQLIRGNVTILIAPPGVGKSTASIAWGLSVATNKNLFGLQVKESGAVGIINNEDDKNEMTRRICALKKYYKITDEELKGRFFVQSGEQQQFVVAKRNHNTKNITPHHKDDIIAFCIEHKIKVLIIDPFLETHEANENDNREISDVAKMFRDIAQKANCAICLIHHTRKQPNNSSNGLAGNMDSGRGASSLIGSARIVCTLYDMCEKDAEQYGVSEEERHLYIRLDDAKANLSLKSNQAQWYKRETVNLANSDTVGVLRPAPELQDAVPVKKSTHADFLLHQIKTHWAFEILRNEGKINRESFLHAMKESGAYLGRLTGTRSTLQTRANEFLLGKGISDDSIKVNMKKNHERYTVYAEFQDADLLLNAEKKQAGV